MNSFIGRVVVERVDDNKVAYVALEGEHDSANAHAVRDTLLELAAERVSAVLDLEATEFMDSSIIHAIYQGRDALTSNGCRLILRVGTPSGIRRVLEITGLLDALPHTDSRDMAVRLANQEPAPPQTAVTG
jgi:anti-sigma B factor antagonist